MHQSTLPLVRAAMSAEKSAAAAPSMAPLPPPATSCSAPRASPPPGSRESNSASPKGSTDLARRLRPSIFSTCARRDSRRSRAAPLGLTSWRLKHHVLYLFHPDQEESSLGLRLFVPVGTPEQAGRTRVERAPRHCCTGSGRRGLLARNLRLLTPHHHPPASIRSHWKPTMRPNAFFPSFD